MSERDVNPGMERARFHVRTFGGLEITRNDGAVIGARDLNGIKPKRLLEILLLARGRAVSKDRLATMLWGDRLPLDVAGTLETYVSIVRQRLQPGVSRPDSVIVTEPGGYRIDVERVGMDLDELDRSVRAADAASPQDALRLLISGAELVTGELLADEPYEEWVLAPRHAYQRVQLGALLRAGRLALELGDSALALELAERVIADDPTEEAAYCVVIEAATALGRRCAALRAWTRCERALAEELGVTPSPATVQLRSDLLGALPRATVPMQPLRRAAVRRTTAPLRCQFRVA